MNKVLILNLPFSIFRFLRWKFPVELFYWLIFFAIGVSLVFYIFQINTLISENYQIKNYRQKIETLTNENNDLEINSLKINSLENIEAKIKNLGFEKINKIYYIQILENQIVSK